MSLFKGFKHITCDKSKFKLTFVPISLTVYTNSTFTFKLQDQRGSQDPQELKPAKCERSLRNSDIKTINFEREEIEFETCFFIEKDVP